MYYEDEFYANDDDHSVSSQKNKIKRALAEANKVSRNYLEYNRIAPNGKKKQIGCYTSGSQGRLITNAISGEKYNCRVGSAQEDLFFKVGMSTGEHRPDGVTLFFEKPEDYERHFMTSVSQQDKQRWHLKSMTAKVEMGVREAEKEGEEQEPIVVK
jgi:hypothetical protein